MLGTGLGTEEYLFTLGILIAFVGTILFLILSRKEFLSYLKKLNIGKRELLIALAIGIFFVAVELVVVKPTQQLFFDDAIYQGGAQDLLHMGQAWMCNFGTPNYCFAGQLFHEPVGTSFNLAIGFAIFGISQFTTYGVSLFISFLAVFLTFIVAALLFKNIVAAYFSELLMALSPTLLVWAMPTTSDIMMMSYSLVSMLALLLFAYKKNLRTLGMFLFSLSLLAYMKIDAAVFVLISLLVYLSLKFPKDIKNGAKEFAGRVKYYLIDTRLLILILVFVISISPEVIYAATELFTGHYGYSGTTIYNSCSPSQHTVATGMLNLQNFNYNICANLLFWTNSFANPTQYGYSIMQPIEFTALALLGAILLFVYEKREFFALTLWFVILFLLYTSFYAGSVIYGVDWRFFLSLMPQASMLGGFGVGVILTTKWIKKSRFKPIFYTLFIILILYSTFSLYNYLSINPSNISEAQPARFYENFVYNNSYKIPSSCLVGTYDPTLFNINNKTATQLSNFSGITYSEYKNLSAKYDNCLVIDYGFWCYTPGNICSSTKDKFYTEPIATSYDNVSAETFGFYKITGFKNAT